MPRHPNNLLGGYLCDFAFPKWMDRNLDQPLLYLSEISKFFTGCQSTRALG